ncbi:hypothetical protein [Paraburkholderia phenoliruptrix]|nr:hypothetical protein [Paraburkholderia phenoliruptrix]MBW0449017.1 hypothetical protein [Paraburkholderia phenoliruptrix]MBW9097426.1 hypothetical protein [Paraburkholderia phenoliruptrix]
MSNATWQIATSGGTVLVQNLPYAAVWDILQYLETNLNLQGLVFSKVGS